MDIGIGLPSTIGGVTGGQILEWARSSDARGFSTLGVLDRLIYHNYEPLAALSAAAAVTQRIRLTTAVLLAPLRTNAALLAKEAATIQTLSGGRLVLGMSVGARQDDFVASAVDYHARGKLFDALLDTVTRIWADESPGGIGPSLASIGTPPILIGGTSDASFSRVARYGAGWISGGGGAGPFAESARNVRAAWAHTGRAGQPRLAALAYFALGPDARQHADRYLLDYYGFAGQYAERVASAALVEPAAVRDALAAFEAAGCDEVILFPCSPDIGQVDLLADSVR